MEQTDLDAPRLTLSDVFGARDGEDHEELARRDPRATIRGRASDPAPTSALDRLRASARSPEPRSRIERIEEIGRGGMGVVTLAEQCSLGRTVALKELREDVRGRATSLSLLREAWVLGSMEHPNVVPVYDLMLDERGDPILVLKRIEGESWASLLDDEARVREQYGATGVLEWHLSVLVQVTNAVSFAHSRGLVHRDIKPENVMIGRFGEVYLVDWGIAVALTDDGTGRFPLAKEVQSFAGTPRYMAPEMLGGRAAQLGVHTDVYLLGATLFHVLSGHAPHTGETIMEIATCLALEDPVLPEGAPPRLREICRTAMAREPAERYASADAFRAALLDYARRRDALLLVDEGERKLAALVALAAGPIADPEAHRLRMFNTYSESRLGFQLARRMWAESAEAREGLQEVGEVMIGYLLEQGDVASATTLVGQLARPLAGDLASRYERAREIEGTQKRRLAELEALGRDHDRSVGRRARLIAYTVLAGLFVVAGAAGHFSHPWETHLGLIAVSMATLMVLAIVGIAGRRTLLSSAFNRDLFFAVCVGFAGRLLVHVSIALLGQPPSQGNVLLGLVYGTVAAMVAIRSQPRLWPIAIAFFGAAIAGAAWPDARYLFYSAASLVMLLNLVWVHRHESARDAERPSAPRTAIDRRP